MSAKKITNNTISQLGLPGGAMIPPKGTVQVEDFDKIKDHDVVKAWLESGALTLGEPREADEGDDGDSDTAPRTSAGSEGNRLTAERQASAQALNGPGNEPIGTVHDGGKKGEANKATGAKPWAAADEGRSAADAQANLKQGTAEQRAAQDKAKK